MIPDRERSRADIVARTGIDEAMIARLVHGFYDRVRADPVLAPIFAAHIPDERWPMHLGRMCAFWSSVALMTGDYHGRPMQAHQPLAVEASDFDRWLMLFRATAHDLTPAAAAEHFIERAERIAASLEYGIEAFQKRSLGRAGGLQLPAMQ
ncbi:MAG: group III truncated hemoglobin [Hyphomicrobiales bacterium]|nr:group III truncated hemoglobin [Hyphomicrobiales bacterium]MDE2116178.1 group III truncated hemoglobin [Hyphomicrobiales bacterium]